MQHRAVLVEAARVTKPHWCAAGIAGEIRTKPSRKHNSTVVMALGPATNRQPQYAQMADAHGPHANV